MHKRCGTAKVLFYTQSRINLNKSNKYLCCLWIYERIIRNKVKLFKESNIAMKNKFSSKLFFLFSFRNFKVTEIFLRKSHTYLFWIDRFCSLFYCKSKKTTWQVFRTENSATYVDFSEIRCISITTTLS